MWAFLAALFQFVLILFSEYFSAKARARQEEKEFKLSQEKFQELVRAALVQQHEKNPNPKPGWDEADKP